MSTPNFPPVIGLTGAAGSGQDTVRGMLEAHGYIGIAFADPMRSMLAELLEHAGLPEAWLTDRQRKEESIPWLGLSYRPPASRPCWEMAQTLGTEWGRAQHPDFWLRIASMRMGSYGEDARFVISDVRFANEAKLVRELGGVIWRIQRPGIEAVRPHVSETELANIRVDDLVNNHGTIEQLQMEVDWALRVSQFTRNAAEPATQQEAA